MEAPPAGEGEDRPGDHAARRGDGLERGLDVLDRDDDQHGACRLPGIPLQADIDIAGGSAAGNSMKLGRASGCPRTDESAALRLSCCTYDLTSGEPRTCHSPNPGIHFQIAPFG